MKELQRNSLLVSIFSNWATLIVAILVGFFLTSYVIKYLGPTGFGIWTLIHTIVGYYGILDLGVESAVTRYVARYSGQKDYKALNQSINTALALFLLLGILVTALSFLIAAPLVAFFNTDAAYAEAFKMVVIILGISVGISFPGNLFSAVMKAHERFFEANIVDIAVILTRAVFVILFLIWDWGLEGIAYANLIAAALTLAFNLWFCLRLFPHVKFDPLGGTLNMLRALMKFGIGAATQELASILRFNLDVFVIGRWINLTAVGIYSVAGLLMGYYLQFISSATISVFTARFSHLDGEGKSEELRRLFFKSLSIAAFLSFAIATPLLILADQFVLLWANHEFLSVLPALWLLTIAYAIMLSQSTGIAMMYALHKHQLFAIISLLEGLSNLALSIYLAPKYGILGVAWGTIIPMLIIKIFIQPWYIGKILHISVLAYLWQLLPPLLLAMGLVTLSLYAPQFVPQANNYLLMAFWGMMLVLPFLLLYFYLFPADRTFIWHKIQTQLKRL